MNEIFPILIFNGRPAAGKSEVIDYIKHCPLEERISRFHIGEIEEIDDFHFLWERFEDDDLIEEMGFPRLISDRYFHYEGKTYEGYSFKELWFWNFQIRKISFRYSKLLRDKPLLHEKTTLLIEFSRGTEHGGFQSAYSHLSEEILTKAATLYISVPWEESLKRNRRRYNPDKPDSGLQHGLEDKKMEKLYKDSDWESWTAADPHYLHVKNHKVPYGVFQNFPEITDKPELLADHLQELINRLWTLRKG